MADEAVNTAQAIADRLAQQGSDEQFPVSSGAEQTAEPTVADGPAAAINNKRAREDDAEAPAEDADAQMRKRASFTGPEVSEVRVTAVLLCADYSVKLYFYGQTD